MYDYDFMYIHINEVMNNILSDEMITLSEENYLNSLYNYTDILIKEYKKIVGDLAEDYDYDQQIKLERKIVDIYNNYSQKAEDKLNSKEYSFLKDYKGDFKDADFQKAKNYCEEVFSKLVSDQTLKYDNRYEINNEEYIFKAYEDRDYNKELFIEKKNEPDVDYEVSYNKITNKVVVRAVSFIVPSKRNKEAEIDHIANQVISKFNPDFVNYGRYVEYDEEKKLWYISYGYIEKINGVYNETKKINMVIEGHGLISKFEIIYPNDENIKIPTIKKEEILSKINKKAVIKDCNIRRNIKGKIEYVIHIEHKGTLYEVIFDGEDGTLKSYDRNIQVKYINSEALIKAES